jgi:SEC-C motif-containing protein
VPGSSAEELLEAAARGRVGVDRRFVQGILDSGDAAGVLRFARASHENDRIELEPLLIDLFRYFQTPEALEFYVDVIRRAPEEIDDSLIQALLPFGAKAVEPLLALYDQLGEEQGSDIGFLLAALRLRDARVLQILLDRLEYDAADGAFCLGLYGDPSAKSALEKMLAEIPESEQELRREITHAIEQLDAPEPHYQPEPFDILAEYPERELPPFDVLDEAERIEMLSSTEADVRAGAAHSFFNQALNAKSRAALFEMAKSDSEVAARGEAWAALGDAIEDAVIREAMIAALNDSSKPVEERGGAAVGLYAVADRDDVRKGLEALYEMGGKARIRALEAMWRSLWAPYAKYFPPHLDDKDPKLLRHAIRGAGYFRLTRYADKIAGFFDREDPYDDLREDALFAYALAMPGETTRGRARGLLRKIDALAGLSPAETELVMFALDERLRLHGLAPVFEGGEEEHEHEVQPEPATPSPPQKIGRNHPCPCGSGKKYKKCHGA